MGKFKPLIITAIIALAAVAIATRVPAISFSSACMPCAHRTRSPPQSARGGLAQNALNESGDAFLQEQAAQWRGTDPAMSLTTS